MSNDPSQPPDPVNPQQEDAARYHRPSFALFAISFLLLIGFYWFIRRPMPEGETRLSLMAWATASTALAGSVIAVYVRYLHRLTWRQALAYSGVFVGAMVCADITRIFLFY